MRQPIPLVRDTGLQAHRLRCQLAGSFVGFGRFDEGGLAVNNVLEAVDKLPHLSGGDPACAFGGRVDFAISRSFPYDLGCFDPRGWKSSTEKLVMFSWV
ncbi:hypothetical protein PENVUL_c019G02124 [Penicillium vulpinum]|uniref:Uncharacterized protein n=1 Tax=Penicillium vulpinum TaxID=29845 RepID=A0A1V6RWW3_9EURO|nr:hypothetical protein PENVUL_c019G02124 [Penicillium vulpinum]